MVAGIVEDPETKRETETERCLMHMYMLIQHLNDALTGVRNEPVLDTKTEIKIPP